MQFRTMPIIDQSIKDILQSTNLIQISTKNLCDINNLQNFNRISVEKINFYIILVAKFTNFYILKPR